MSISISEVYDYLNNLAPLQIQESYDNSGLQVGSLYQTLKGILLCVDATQNAINYAIKKNFNLIISHHPLIFNPLYSINFDSLIGKKISLLIKNEITLLSWHTPLDKIPEGVTTAFLNKVGFTGSDFILKDEKNQNYGLGRIVYLEKSIKLLELSQIIKNATNSWVMIVGNPEEEIDSFGICAGSGSSLKPHLQKLKINTLITSDVKYHSAKDAEEEGFNFIILDHGIMEKFVLEYLKNNLTDFFKEKQLEIPIEIYEEESPIKIIN